MRRNGSTTQTSTTWSLLLSFAAALTLITLTSGCGGASASATSSSSSTTTSENVYASAAKVALKHHLLPLPVEDNQIYCPGVGTCVAFFQDNIAAFGNPTQIQTMLQARLGLIAQLSSNRALSDLMNSTQSKALVRGVALGNQIHSVVESSVPDLSAIQCDWSAVSSVVTMFAYSIDIDTKAHVTATLDCNSAAAAFLLGQLLNAFSTVRAMQISSAANTIEVKLDTALP